MRASRQRACPRTKYFINTMIYCHFAAATQRDFAGAKIEFVAATGLVDA
jgi:hypothetical protein